MLIKIQDIIDGEKCFEIIRSKRWRNDVRCVSCQNEAVVCNGHYKNQPNRQQYKCTDCEKYFDDLTDNIFMISPIQIWWEKRVQGSS